MITPSNSFNDSPKDNDYRLTIQTIRAAKQPLSRREIHNRTGIEITNLCRVLYNLTYKRHVLEIAKYANCPQTKKTVMHFYFKAKEVPND